MHLLMCHKSALPWTKTIVDLAPYITLGPVTLKKPPIVASLYRLVRGFLRTIRFAFDFLLDNQLLC